MNHLNKLLVFSLFFFLFQNTNAQFTLSGEIRPKFMLMDGYKELFNETKYPYGLVIQRSRLNFDYTKDNLSFAFSIQDVRAWGQDAYTSNNNSVGVFEAYVKYGFCKQFAVKFGRQQLKYDDERLLSYNNWRDQGVSHDIAVFQYNNDNKAFKADLGMAMNNPLTYQNYLTEYTNKNYKYMAYIWLNQKLMQKKLEVSAIGIADVNQKPSTTYIYNTRYTFGPYISYKYNNLNINGSAYYQGGKLADGKKINALFYAIKTSYKVHKNLDLAVGYEYYSGTNFEDTTKAKTESTTFDKLYGSGHSFLGYMDYFTGSSSDFTKGAGINDFYAKINFTLNEKHNIEAFYHYFMLDKAYFLVSKKASIKYNKALGHEIDLLYTYKQSKVVNLSLGYSFFLPTETMENLHGYKKGDSKFAQFAYLMLTIKPVFFNYTEK